jgi:trehalose 6-phosphate phosphatase
MLPDAGTRVGAWCGAWRRSGALVLLLDFDGTLAPIVAHADEAAMPPETRVALDRLRAMPGVTAAVVSGRALADVRARAALDGIPYAGNHGMEIEGPGVHRIHPEAQAARPSLEVVAARLAPALVSIPGAFLEDKGLTLSLHYRMAAEGAGAAVRALAEAAVAGREELALTEGKMVLEVRPRVDWHKGKAVLFLLDHLRPPAGAPVLYLGDDRTDEDAFRALRASGRGEGVLISPDPPADSAAAAHLADPHAVGAFFAALADCGPVEG